MADLAGADGAILLADPVTFPTDAVLRFLTESTPMLPLLGGLASGRTLDDETVLFIGDEVVERRRRRRAPGRRRGAADGLAGRARRSGPS